MLRKATKKTPLRLLSGLLLLCMLMGIVACTQPNTPDGGIDSTDPETTESTPQQTEQPTAETESETEAKTEPETQGPQIEITPESPTSGKLITFYENSVNSMLIEPKYSTAEIVKDGEASVIKLTTDGEKIRDPSMTLDYAKDQRRNDTKDQVRHQEEEHISHRQPEVVLVENTQIVTKVVPYPSRFFTCIIEERHRNRADCFVITEHNQQRDKPDQYQVHVFVFFEI